MWIQRSIAEQVKKLVSTRPCVLITGARQVGKSSLLQKLYPEMEYVTLDNTDLAEEALYNPRDFLNQFNGRSVIIDEIQYAPTLFRELKILIDQDRNQYGKWLLTGSQKYALMQGVSESLAGRIGLLELYGLSAQEMSLFDAKINLNRMIYTGGYPELWQNSNIQMEVFFSAYVQTYLERDLKQLVNVSNLADFRRFLIACAVRAGQLVNYSNMAKDVGVSAVTIKSWLSALETSGLVCLLPPFYKNIGKRLIKAPKMYFYDNGLLCYLLNILDETALSQHVYKDQVWENFVFTELSKTMNITPGVDLFFYRDQNAVEIDFLIDKVTSIDLIEVKNTQKIDQRKLNFNKVEPLFNKEEVNKYVACKTSEKRMVKLKDYTMYNPLFSYLKACR